MWPKQNNIKLPIYLTRFQTTATLFNGKIMLKLHTPVLEKRLLQLSDPGEDTAKSGRTDFEKKYGQP